MRLQRRTELFGGPKDRGRVYDGIVGSAPLGRDGVNVLGEAFEDGFVEECNQLGRVKAIRRR